MRWLTFFIIAYVAVGLQIGLGPHVRLGLAGFNLPLLVAVFVAINAPRDVGLLACFIVGAMQDLVTADTMGLYALSYGLFALVVSGASQSVKRGHPLTHIAMTLLGSVINAFIIYLHGAIKYFHGVPIGVGALFASIIYTTLLSPIIVGALHQMAGVFGFESVRRRMR